MNSRLHIVFNALLIILFGMINGVHDGWGYIEPYIASFLHETDPTIKTSQIQWLYFSILVCSVISGFLQTPIKKIMGYKGGIWLSFILQGTGMLICYASKTYMAYVAGFQGIGLGITIQFQMNSFLMMSIMPDNLAFAAGIGNAGHGLSPVYWAQISKSIINPDNIKPEQVVTEGYRHARYFGDEVTSNVPRFFYINAMVMFGCAFVLVPFLAESEKGIFGKFYRKLKAYIYKTEVSSSNNQKEDNNVEKASNKQENIASIKEDDIIQEKISKNQDLEKQGSEYNSKRSVTGSTKQQLEDYDKHQQIRSKLSFWQLFQCLTYILGMPSFFLINIKNFGYRYFDDKMLTHISIFATCVAFISRMGCGILIDKYGTIKTWKVLMIFVSFAVLIFYFLRQEFYAFLFCIGVFYVIYCFASVLLPGLTTFFFGIEVGELQQKYMFLAKAFGALVAVSMDTLQLEKIGLEPLIVIILVINILIFLTLSKLEKSQLS